MIEPSARKRLVSLLNEWRRGAVDERNVHETAEALLAAHGWRELPRDDPESIVLEVIGLLEVLNHELVVREDIPAIVAFLAAKPGEEREAWERWERYWESIDMEKRKQLLEQHRYYCT